MSEHNENRPLAGILVLVTRALERSAGLVDKLTAQGADVRVIPAVTITPLPEPEGFEKALDRLSLYENVIFTSVNGVVFTLELLSAKGSGPWDFPPALCVGEKTAAAWEDSGGVVAAFPERYTAESLLEILGSDLAGRAFLIMRPEVVRTELGQAMRDLGAAVDEVVLYRTDHAGKSAGALRELMESGGPDVIFFASPSAVEGTVEMAAQSPSACAGDPADRKSGTQRKVGSSDPETGPRTPDHRILDIPVICIGPTTARAAEASGFTEVYFPDEHTAEGMVEELLVISGKLKKTECRMQNVE